LLILSGRRGLVIAVLFSFVTIFFLQFFLRDKIIRFYFKKKKSSLKKILFFLFFSIIIFIFNTDYINIEKTIEVFLSGFDFENSLSDGAYLRYLQFESLLSGWQNYPIFGSGYGASASMTRSDEMPWAYELSYLALLFHTGMIGIIIYGSATLWIFWQLIVIIRGDNQYFIKIAFPTFVGMVSFLIANSTNPYLGKFDLMWIIFIPVLIINLYKLEGKKNEKKF
jgi:hypothetical protein